MNSKKLLLWTFIASFVLAALHLGALEFSLYWLFWWFDIVTHFVGGVVVALISLFLYSKYGSTEHDLTKQQIFFLSVAIVIIVGILWEGFELVIGGRAFADPDYTLDTIADMLTAISGGLLVYGIINRVYDKKT